MEGYAFTDVEQLWIVYYVLIYHDSGDALLRSGKPGAYWFSGSRTLELYIFEISVGS